MLQTGPPVISQAGSPRASALAFHGPSGVGKSSLAACFSKPIIAPTRDEGILTLIDAGMVAAVEHFEPINTFPALEANLTWLEANPGEYRTLVIDGLSGVEQALADHVCETRFGGDLASFSAYGRGWEEVAREFDRLLRLLDRLRAKRITVVILAHSKVGNVSNPSGPDYSRHVPDVRDRLWAHLHKWLDLFAFLTFDVEVKAAAGGKGKAVGGARRVLYTEERPAFVAKNRFGLPFQIQGDGPGAGPLYAAFAAAMREAKSRSQQRQTVSSPTEIAS
jgi:hypothetical protein